MAFILRCRFCHIILGPTFHRVVVALLVGGDGALVVVCQAEAVALRGKKEGADWRAGWLP